MSIQDPDATLPAQGYGTDATAPVTRPVPRSGGGPGGGGPGGGGGARSGGGGGYGADESDPRRLWFIAGGVLVLGLIIGTVVALAAGGGGKDESTSTSSSSSTSSSTSTSTSTSTTSTTTGAGPTILQFTINPSPVNCPEGGGIVNVNLVWATTNTSGVTISIDGPAPYGTYGPTDNQQLPFSCPAGQHTYLLTANGQNGQKVQKQIVVTGIAPTTTTLAGP